MQNDFTKAMDFRHACKIFDENNFQIEDVGTDSLSALKAAQMVLRKPLKTSFEEMEKLNHTED